MRRNDFDLFEGIELTEEEKKYFDIQKQISDIVVRLIKKRVELNLSQRDLAELTGIKQPMIARIENMETTPRIDTLVKIATALNLHLSFDESVVVNINFDIKIKYNEETNYSFKKFYEPAVNPVLTA